MRVRLALATTVLMWCAAFVAIRRAAPDYPIGGFLLLRFAVPAVAFAAWGIARGGLLPPRGDRLRVVALAVFFVAYIGLLIAGERTVDAGTASVLAETSPLFTFLAAALLLGEGFGLRLLLGLVVSFLGAVVIARAQGGSFHGSLGALLVVGAALAQAAMFIVQKPLLSRQPAVRVISQATIVAMLATLPFAGDLRQAISSAPPSATASVVFVALTTGLVSYVTLAYAMARSDSTGAVSSVLYLVPPGAVLISWATLGELPRPLAVVGGVLAILGVAIVQRSPARARRA
jgi:drug/metabolite transporter (DMT)-like permease